VTSPDTPIKTPRRGMNRIKIAALLLTAAGVGLFAYFVYSIGLDEIRDGIGRFSLIGFGIILALYFIRICARAAAWRLCTHEPYSLRMRDTVPAVMIGEALSSTVPLGILISGTSKAIAVRKRIPLVAGMSSVATENLFYSLVTGLFLISGALVLLLGFGIGEGLHTALIGARRWLDSGRHKVRLFENLVYGFYRRHPNLFLPVIGFEILYHMLGVAEVWIILTRVSEAVASPASAFLLESVSRLINIVFKLVPFLIGVDEAGARYVGEVIAVGAGTAVTLTIIRKGRILFWTAIGFALIIRRGLTFGEISSESSKMLDR
jgi:hypothetical protein